MTDYRRYRVKGGTYFFHGEFDERKAEIVNATR